MTSTRERQLKFITDAGSSALEDAVARYLAENGPYFLSDETVEELAAIEVRRRRADQHRMIRNRPILRASLGLTRDLLASVLQGVR